MTSHLDLVILDSLADWEIGYLTAYVGRQEFQREPGSVALRTVGITGQPIRTVGGLQVVPDVTIDDLDPETSAILVLPGADTWGEERHRPFVDQARRYLAAGTPVAAICGATYALASAGLLDDVDHTGPDPHFLASSGYAGADRYRNELVVTDGDVITASPVAPVEFARAVFARTGLYEPEVLASWFKLYGEQDAAGYHELYAS